MLFPFAAAMKDHYQNLNLLPQATLQEIKKAFRSLAQQYHPDKNGDSEITVERFRGIQESYQILSNPLRRQRYDEERWLSGFSRRPNVEALSPQWILKQAEQLKQHLSQSDSLALDYTILRACLLYLLSDNHLAILLKEGTTELRQKFFGLVLPPFKLLPQRHVSLVILQLAKLAVADNLLQKQLDTVLQQRKRAQVWSKLRPVLLILALLAIMVEMYFWAKGK